MQQTSQQAATSIRMQISMQLQSIRPLTRFRPVLFLTCPAGPCAPSCIAAHASSTGRVKLMFRSSSDSRASTTACKGAEGGGDTWGEGKQPGRHKRCWHGTVHEPGSVCTSPGICLGAMCQRWCLTSCSSSGTISGSRLMSCACVARQEAGGRRL